MILAAAVFFLFRPAFDKWYDNQITFVAPQVAYAGETVEGKIDRLKEKVLDDMTACENPSHLLTWNDDNALGTLPKKDKPSNGDLAYKISTVQRHYKILNSITLSDRDALLLALDTDKARDLAMNAWLHIKGSINEWSCATPEMKTRIEDIRLLEGITAN